MRLSIVVPCFNEQESIPYFLKETQQQVAKLPVSIEYIFVNDGSTDETLAVLKRFQQQQPQVIHYLDFSRNFGKEAAIYAGLKAAKGDLITIMDADLQDPPELLPKMFELITEQGYDCVATRRENRQGEPLLRSFFARKFYKLMNKISETPMVDGARDFRLMTRQMVDAVLEMSEYNRFSKGLFSWVGFRTTYLSFKNKERVAGKTSWSFWGLVRYSAEGIVNFSNLPLQLAAWGGILACLVAILMILVIVVRTLVFGDPTSGWPSLVSIILFMGGLQLFFIGILGQYIGKIYLEVKQRPIYLIRESDLPDFADKKERNQS